MDALGVWTSFPQHSKVTPRIKVVRDYEERLKAFGFDLFGCNPDPHNIYDGLSSVEEEALGAIAKGGTNPLTEVVRFGNVPKGKGLFYVDAPGSDGPAQTALAAAGCNIITHSTKCIDPMTFPFVPTVKITARRDHFKKFPDALDYLVDIDKAVSNINEVGKELFNLMLEVASGRKTQDELIGWTGSCDLWVITPKT